MSTNPGNTDPIDATASDNLTPEERAKMAKFWEQREGKSANGNTTAHGSSDDQNGSEAHDPVAVGDAESEPEQIEMTDKPRSLREAAGGGWVIVPNNLPVDAKIQPAEIVQQSSLRSHLLLVIRHGCRRQGWSGANTGRARGQLRSFTSWFGLNISPPIRCLNSAAWAVSATQYTLNHSPLSPALSSYPRPRHCGRTFRSS